MAYELAFLETARKEWHKLDENTRGQFGKKLMQRLLTPLVPSSRLA